MINALFVLIVFLLQLNKDNLHVKWPISARINVTYDEITQEVNLGGVEKIWKHMSLSTIQADKWSVKIILSCNQHISLDTPNQVASINSILFLSFLINYFDHHGKKYDTSKLFEWTQKFWIVPVDKKNEIWNFRLRYQSIWTDCTTNKQKTENRLALPPTWKNFGINPFSLSSCSTHFSFWSCSYSSWTKINFTYSGR